MPRCLPASSTAVGGCNSKKLTKANTLEELVEEYQKAQQDPAGKCDILSRMLKHYRGMKSLNDVLECAADAQNVIGRRHSHQYRILKGARVEALKILKAGIKNDTSFGSFEKLHDWFASKCATVSGLGPLYVYDTCLRIGAYLKLAPKKVYLHAGVLKGACALMGTAKVKILPASAFPPAMRVLKPHEIEDFLCVYKSQLGNSNPDPDLRVRLP